MSYKEANAVLNYWFEGGDPSKRPQWFGGGEEAVKEIKDKFGPLGSPLFTLRDPYCEELARKFIKQETHHHLKFSPAGRAFLYLPLEHSENRETQELSVQMFAKLEEDTRGTESESYWKQSYHSACLHKEIVDQIGRFPQRNKVLGRENTPEEEDMVKKHA